MGRSIAAHPAAGRHLGDDGVYYAVGLNSVSNFFEFRALVVLAEVASHDHAGLTISGHRFQTGG
ncbi:MAG TPA: hypothetical protein VIK56_08610 [Rhodoferax sp.]